MPYAVQNRCLTIQLTWFRCVSLFIFYIHGNLSLEIGLPCILYDLLKKYFYKYPISHYITMEVVL